MHNEKKGVTTTVIELPAKDNDQRLSHSLLLVPNNWLTEDTDYVYPTSLVSVVKLLKQKNIPVDTLHPIDATTLLQDNRAIDWISPTVVISSLLLTQQPDLVSIALNIISNYVTDIFKGINADPKVKLNILQVAENGKTQRVEYAGPVSGLSEVIEVVKALSTFEQSKE